MITEIKIPQIGESITEVELAKWLISDGDYVEKDQEIAEIDSDKATITINAETAGKIKILKEEGESLEIGSLIGSIDSDAKKPKESKNQKPKQEDKTKEDHAETKNKVKESKTKEKDVDLEKSSKENQKEPEGGKITFSPQAKRLLDEINIEVPNPEGSRITKKDILAAIAGQYASKGKNQGIDFDSATTKKDSRNEEVKKMSTLRKKIAERLVAVKNETAMLTTFNEVDMSKIIDIRKKNKESFQEKYGVKLGFMSFFVKAVTESIKDFPLVNGYIKDSDIIVPEYADIGIAVSTPKGLMVPVIRNAESKSIAELEISIAEMADKARNNKISIDDLSGGTFSITNGGVFGSLLATPIINPPQSAILGMHNIVERPIALNGQVVIRPMMYIALSYDHRIIDGKESVGFLVKIKEYLENPVAMTS